MSDWDSEPEARLPTWIWVDALVRRAEAGGAFASVLHKGDEARGDVLVKLRRFDGRVRLLGPRTGPGGRVFVDRIAPGFEAGDPEADAFIARARERDYDLWVLEVEDRAGRSFLTENEA